MVACVAMCPAVREKLGPALIHTYSSVDIVEGLDVDKEEFDKFSARYNQLFCCPEILNATAHPVL